MTTKKEETAVAVNQSQALVEQRPDFLTGNDRRGLEDMDRSDISLPRVALAQLMNPQVTEGDPNRIEGLAAGDMFNSMTGQNYGRELKVQVVLKCKLRAMHFKPIDEGGGILDPDVPLDSPLLVWGDKGEKPEATLFRDYIAIIHPTGEMVALSFKSSGIKVAKQLNSLVTMRNAPIFAGLYRITTAQELKPKPHKVFKVENAGWVDKAAFDKGAEMHEAMKGIDIKIDREEKREDPEDFPFGANTPGGAGHSEM